MALDLNRIPLVLSPHRTITNGRSVDLVVIHDMEWAEKNTTAEDCAAMFKTSSRKASAHYCVDADSIVQCVPLKDVAWAAPGANHNGVQIELAGFARQSAAEWADAYSSGMLDRAAELVAHLCKLYSLPVEFVDAAKIKLGRRGITTHVEVTRAFPERGDGHTDPGPNFPMGGFIADIRVERDKLEPIVSFQLIIGGRIAAESAPVEGRGPLAERLRLQSFLNNQLRRIHANVGAPAGGVTIKRKLRQAV